MVSLVVWMVNKQRWLVITMLCLTEVGLYFFCKDSFETSVPYFSQKSVVRINPMRTQEMLPNYSIADQIWNFNTPGIEKVYLFKTLLRKQHSFNDTSVKVFRKELREYMGPYFKDYLVVDQQNTPKNFSFTFGSGQNSKAVLISEDIYKLLPNKVNYDDIHRCSVVGNSGSILNSTCAEEVDKADYVFRCNAAPIKAFSRDAGCKSNFTTLNPSIFRTRYQNPLKPNNVPRFLADMKEYRGLLWAPCFNYNSLKECISVLKMYNLTENKFVLGHPDHFSKVQTYWKSHGLKKRITTGFYLVTVALSRCSQVHLFGFWPFFQMVEKSIKHIPYHFFDKVYYNLSNKDGYHNMHSEFSILVQLHNLGILKIHVNECSH